MASRRLFCDEAVVESFDSDVILKTNLSPNAEIFVPGSMVTPRPSNGLRRPEIAFSETVHPWDGKSRKQRHRNVSGSGGMTSALASRSRDKTHVSNPNSLGPTSSSLHPLLSSNDGSQTNRSAFESLQSNVIESTQHGCPSGKDLSSSLNSEANQRLGKVRLKRGQDIVPDVVLCEFDRQTSKDVSCLRNKKELLTTSLIQKMVPVNIKADGDISCKRVPAAVKGAPDTNICSPKGRSGKPFNTKWEERRHVKPDKKGRDIIDGDTNSKVAPAEASGCAPTLKQLHEVAISCQINSPRSSMLDKTYSERVTNERCAIKNTEPKPLNKGDKHDTWQQRNEQGKIRTRVSASVSMPKPSERMANCNLVRQQQKSESVVVNRHPNSGKGDLRKKLSGDSDRVCTPENAKVALPSEAPKRLTKKVKKTDGQKKKEFREKLKSLPSVQGKVLTVSHDFYNLVIDNKPRLNSSMKMPVEQEISSFDGDFPALGEDRQTNEPDTDAAHQDVTPSAYQLSDSEWSDIDCYYNNGSVGKSDNHKLLSAFKYNEEFPALGRDDSRCSHLLDQSQAEQSFESQQEAGVEVVLETNKPHKKPKSNSKIQVNLMSAIAKQQKVAKNKDEVGKLSKNRLRVKPVVANILDSSAPVKRRGKERERPAVKKHTPIKKVILRERKERTVLSQQPTNGNDVAAFSLDSPGNDDNQEYIHNVESLTNKSKEKATEARIHSRRFREYCNQMVNSEIDEVATTLIQDLIRFHDRIYVKDPVKARMRRRIVVGLREVTKHLKLKRIKCVILAPNLENIKSSGGLNDAIELVISLAQEQGIPYVFALERNALGHVCLKKVPVSCVGIFNYDGSETNFKRLCELATLGQREYDSLCHRESDSSAA